jgi:hypothetical protein
VEKHKQPYARLCHAHRVEVNNKESRLTRFMRHYLKYPTVKIYGKSSGARASGRVGGGDLYLCIYVCM